MWVDRLDRSGRAHGSNVVLGTVVLDQDGKAVFNVGSGVIFDSNANEEYDECLLKARFSRNDHTFGLIETLRYEPGHGCIRAVRHLDRLTASALHFNRRIQPN